MAKYVVEYTEELIRTYVVEADSEDAAMEKVICEIDQKYLYEAMDDDVMVNGQITGVGETTKIDEKNEDWYYHL